MFPGRDPALGRPRTASLLITYHLEDGHDILTVWEPLHHTDLSASMIYTHIPNRGGHGAEGDDEMMALRQLIGHANPTTTLEDYCHTVDVAHALLESHLDGSRLIFTDRSWLPGRAAE